MRFALQTLSNGKTLLVDANGKPLGNSDSDCPILHILPKLLVPAKALAPLLSAPYEGLTCNDITLEVTSTLAVSVVPDGGIIVRQPYPNRRYFVGGSPLIRNGWIIPLPLEAEAAEFDIELRWLIMSEGLWSVFHQDEWEVRHLMHIKLQPGKGMTYSMDGSCWPERDGPAMRFSPVTPLGIEEGDPKEHLHRQIMRDSNLVYQDGDLKGELAGYFLEEKVDITGVPLEQAYTIDAFQEEQLHEVRQRAVFDQDNEAHRKNAAVVMPDELFVRAVKLAEEIPFDAESDFAKSIVGIPGGNERHPAMRLLCEWWESVRPEEEPFKPGSAMPMIRIRDDGEYWWGHYEIPNVPVKNFNPSKRDVARIGDLVLVIFCATQKVAKFDDHGMIVMLPSGEPYNTIGISEDDYLSGQYDEAWYCLNALASFRSRFHNAWEFLNKTGGEYRMARRAEVAKVVPLPEGMESCPHCHGMPELTEDPIGVSHARFLMKCGDHISICGDTIEEVLYDWDGSADMARYEELGGKS